jgi:UDP-N-acetylglucosamine 3-dehydrogenase
MSKIKIAVVGLGNMGKHHVKHSQSLFGAELVAVCDTDPKRLEAIKDIAPTTPQFTDIDAMLAHSHIDLACVVVPTSLHGKIAGKLLSKGVHVLVEKPIASTLQEAETLIALAKDNKKRLFVGHVEYFNPAIQAFFNPMRPHDFGHIRHLCARRWSPMPQQITDANVIIDLCIHDLHILTQLISENPTKTTWYEKSHILEGRADAATGILEFSQATASIDANWISSAKVREMEIIGTHGVAKIDLLHQRVLVSSDTSPEWQELPIKKAWPLETELAHVMTSILEGTSSPIDAEQGLRALALCYPINRA